MKRLIVNADDFGFTPDVNAGIVEAHRRGILTATTLMANGEAFDDAVRLAWENPGLDVGVHLVLVGGVSCLTGRPLPARVGELLRAMYRRRIVPEEELRAQVRRVMEAGLHPTHLDTHKHTHLAPRVLAALARVAREFDIRWVRRPFDFLITANPAPWRRRAAGRAFGFLRRRFQGVLERHGCRTTDYFAGFQLTGSLRTSELVTLIHALPDGLTEFMCHPGFCSDALRTARTRLKESRQRELEALTAPETRAALEKCGIALVSYRDL